MSDLRGLTGANLLLALFQNMRDMQHNSGLIVTSGEHAFLFGGTMMIIKLIPVLIPNNNAP